MDANMTPEQIQDQLNELGWIVSKGFQLRHNQFKKFPQSIIHDAIILIRMNRKLNSR